MKKNILVVLFVLFCCVAVFSAASAQKAVGDYKIALILPGSINDQSWNATNYAGLVASNEDYGDRKSVV